MRVTLLADCSSNSGSECGHLFGIDGFTIGLMSLDNRGFPTWY